MLLTIGIIIFLITFYVHNHTYKSRKFNYTKNEYEYFNKYKFPLWGLVIMIIFSIIPILNIILFIIGIITYITNILEENIYFKPGNKIKRFTNFLNKEV